MDYQGSLLGECLGNYRLVRMIGRGSMGEVYEAEHVLIGRRVAVKVLLAQLSRSEEAINRFFTEARTAATLRHPGIVEVFDFGYLPSGSAYIIMELLEGETVTEAVERRAHLPVDEAVHLARKVASAMACAHACGVIHRDLKPENLFLVPDEDAADGVRLKVLDFGIAKLATAQLFGSRTTRTGQIMGTPAFMAPEQCHGACEVDDRSDIYALGCILYYMLTGRPPFVDDGVGATIAAQLYDTPMPPSAHVKGIPARINELVMHMLKKSPDDRPGSMDNVAALLSAWSSRADDSTLPTAPPRLELEILVPAPPAPPLEPPPEPASPLAAHAQRQQLFSLPEPCYSTIELANGALEPHAPGRHRTMRWLAGGAAALTTVGMLSWSSLHDGVDALISRLPALAPVEAAESLVPAVPIQLPAPPRALAPVTAAPRPTPSAPRAAPRSVGKPAPRMITVRITSRPTGASVVRTSDGARLGATPLVVNVAAQSGETSLRLSKSGFRSELLELPADRDAQASIVLSPQRPKVRRARPPSVALGTH